MLLQEATDARKTQISSVIKSLKDKALEKRKEIDELKKKGMDIQDQVAEVKSHVKGNEDQMIAIIEGRKQNVFDAVDNEAKKSLETFSHKESEVENQVEAIESGIEKIESLLKRNSSTEILGFNKTFYTILQQQSTEENRDTECVPRFTFTKSEKLFNVLNDEGIGNVTTFFSQPKTAQTSWIME